MDNSVGEKQEFLDPQDYSNVVLENVNENIPKRKGLPVAAITAACMIVLCEVICSNSIYPYVNFMMKWMKIPLDKQGYYVGLLASSYFLAQFVGSFIWAAISRKMQRKNVLIIGMTGAAISSLLLGVSRHFYLAVLARFLCGLFSGNIGLAKTILAENANNENQARIFSFLGITWGAGSIMGPFLGGVLSDPCNQYNITDKSSAICYFPFLLPNYANCVLLSIAIFIVIITIKPATHSHSSSINSSQDEVNIAMSDLSRDNNSNNNENNNQDNAPSSTISIMLKLIQVRDIWIACVIYSFVAFSWSIFEEVFPLWTFMNGFTLRQLGLLQSFAGLVGIFFQLTTYPVLVRKLGILETLRLGSLSAVFAFFSITWVLEFFPLSTDKAIWIIGGIYIFVQFGAEVLFVGSMTVVANSTEDKDLDLVNYMAQGIASAMRTVGPASGASLFAWSLTNSKAFPLNDHFVFNITTILVLVVFIISFFQRLKNKSSN